jgi:hypothetical protein
MAKKASKYNAIPVVKIASRGEDRAESRQSTQPAAGGRPGSVRLAVCQILCIDGDAEGVGDRRSRQGAVGVLP